MGDNKKSIEYFKEAVDKARKNNSEHLPHYLVNYGMVNITLVRIGETFPIIPNIFTLSPQGNFPMIFQNPKSFQFSLYLLKGNLC